MCIELSGGQENTIAELVAALGDGGDEGLNRLKASANNCPMCILSALKQSKINELDEKTGEPLSSGFIFFDYHKARKEAFDEINDARNIGRNY